MGHLGEGFFFPMKKWIPLWRPQASQVALVTGFMECESE
jgi:hypothetical protein